MFLTQERLVKARGWFTDHGGKVVTIARFVEGLRQANGIVAGTSRMHWLKFLAFNALGAALWVGVWTTLGYVSGSHINAIYGPVSKVLLGVGAAAVLVLIIRAVRRHRSGQAQPAPDTLDTPG